MIEFLIAVALFAVGCILSYLEGYRMGQEAANERLIREELEKIRHALIKELTPDP